MGEERKLAGAKEPHSLLNTRISKAFHHIFNDKHHILLSHKNPMPTGIRNKDKLRTVALFLEHIGISVFHGTASIITFCVGPTYPAILILHLVHLANDGSLQVRLFGDTIKIQSLCPLVQRLSCTSCAQECCFIPDV